MLDGWPKVSNEMYLYTIKQKRVKKPFFHSNRIVARGVVYHCFVDT